MPIQHLPRFDKSKTVQEVRERFLARITPNMDAGAKAALQTQFQQAVDVAVAQAEKEVEQQAKTIAASNCQAFLAAPIEVLDALQQAAGRSYDLGDALQWNGIVTVTSKRHGKGVEIGKGTIGRHTQSQFIAVAVCDPYHLEVETACNASDHWSKARMHANVAEQLARSIAAKAT